MIFVLKVLYELSSDKSLSIRSVLFASIAYGISHIKINNPGEDALTSIMAIKKLGIKVIKNKINILFLVLVLVILSSKKKLSN